MPSHDARPAGETRDPIRPVAVMRSVVGDAFDRVVSTMIEEERGEHPEFNSGDCIHAFYDALEELEAAVRAEARAALLAGAPTVWVATNRHGARVSPVSMLYHGDPAMRDGVATNDNEDDGLYLWSLPQLTPPGTVRRYALVPFPEEET